MKDFIVTSRGVKNKVISLINDPRLTPTMDNMRHGRTQAFREKIDKNGKTHTAFMSNDKTDVIEIEPPEKHIYAELVDGEWYWLNGCCECNGEKRCWVNSYIECEEHDVCQTCGIHRSKLKEAPWGKPDGWRCEPCQDRIDSAHKSSMLLSAREYDEWGFRNLDEVECPYCNEKLTEWYRSLDENDEDRQEITCETCENKYNVAVNRSVSFDVTKIIMGQEKKELA